MDALIAARGLHAYYGSSHVLRGVDFHIGSGETVGLLGRNGMGKTTLLRSLLGHVKPKRGEVRVRGSDMTGAAPEAVARCGVAYVPEGRGIFPNLTVRENLIMAARRASDGGRGWTLERVLEVFPRLGERLAHRGDALSGGEQQMLALGRALLTNPRALLLDEVSNEPQQGRDGIDMKFRAQTLRLATVVQARERARVAEVRNRPDRAREAERVQFRCERRIERDGRIDAPTHESPPDPARRAHRRWKAENALPDDRRRLAPARQRCDFGGSSSVRENDVVTLSCQFGAQRADFREKRPPSTARVRRQRGEFPEHAAVEAAPERDDVILTPELVQRGREIERGAFRAASLASADDMQHPHPDIVPNFRSWVPCGRE